jgi:conjugative relaxase-like TrwC/TraI family protein
VVLTVTGLTNGEYLITSVALSIDEYYAGVGESPGVWSGRWAERLGLSGVVESGQLRALVDGQHPETGEDLLAGSRPRSVRAFDVTFSAPKSVSLLWALSSQRAAREVAAAHREAVEVALGFLEERAAVARVQSRGVRRRVATNGWVVAGFIHRTSREGDPQLHSHCLVPNLVQRAEDGHMVAFDAGPLFEWGRAAGSVYQNHLQRALSQRQGVVWGPDRNNTREMDGFTRVQLRAFSKRSTQIEAELEQKGALYESPALRMQADDEASLATRGAKDHSLTPTMLAGRWRIEAEQVGLAAGQALERMVCWVEPVLPAPSWEEIVAVLVDPEAGLCSRSARFTRADVVEHLCAVSGGRLSLEEITAMADRFVDSDLAVRLTPDPDGGGRRAAQWSTAPHRAMEDRVVALIDALAARPATAVSPVSVEAALAAAPGLGEDQAVAVQVLAGPGGALRAVLAPAGYGKTTMLHAAAQAAGAGGRPVVAVATTAKAVAELSGAGLDAKTIARLRIDLEDGPLAAGTVVVLDEISQTPTDQVEAVLAAVDACPGGTVWVLGDPRQSQPVGPGGVADHIESLAVGGVIASGRLTVNRRQVDAADRESLGLLRRGKAGDSQGLRAEHGWEHQHPSPAETRDAMARAVCDDIVRYGAGQVAALVVSHTDAEDLADRIRARLGENRQFSGPSVMGPGWTTDREYRAGDRVLLHARVGGPASRLVNGTVATVDRVDSEGLTVRIDNGALAMLPAGFVQGTRKDHSPNLSHSWARTVDGAQGGTWQACHLLGSAALDAFRGYTGQSRSRQPTHTWNTTRVGVVDHGGILADQRDPAEQVANALARQPNPTLAATSDPWAIDRQFQARIAEHQRVLAGRPPDCSAALAVASGELRSARDWLANMDAVAGQSAHNLKAISALSGLSRQGRHQRQGLQDKLAEDAKRAAAAHDRYTEVADRVAQLRRQHDALESFDAAEGWRQDDIPRLRDQLDHQWAQIVAACVQADDPLAYGIDKLRHARATIESDRGAIDAATPEDRADLWRQARLELPEVIKERRHAESRLADSQQHLADASKRRWGRHDQDAITAATAKSATAEQWLRQATTAEHELRRHLADLGEHQQRREHHIADVAGERKESNTSLAQIDAALDRTRPDRVAALADNPPEYLLARIGPPPQTAAGQAVWCHHALDIEATLDRNGGRSPAQAGWSPQIDRARHQITVADRVLQAGSDQPGPSEWAELAERAGAVLDQVRLLEHIRAPIQRTANQWQQPQPWIDLSAERAQPGIDL